jgi:hypothetical protein
MVYLPLCKYVTFELNCVELDISKGQGPELKTHMAWLPTCVTTRTGSFMTKD